MNWTSEQHLISVEYERFPLEFGLRGFPGGVFTISRAASYVNDRDEVMLYLYTKKRVQHKGDGNVREEWVAFAKCSPAELRDQMVAL